MTADTVALIVAGAAAGGFINGLAGFGMALFALGFFLQVMDPVQAVSVAVVLSITSGVQGVWIVRHALLANLPRLSRFLLPALLGIPIGMSVLSMLEPRSLKLVIGGFLVLYGGYFSFRKTLPTIVGERPRTDAVIGFLGGVLGGAASLSGALPTMWCSLRDWPKAETRAVLQPYNVGVLGVAAAIFAATGVYTRESLLYIAVAIPVALLTAQIGIAVFRHVNDAGFRRLLIALTLVSGSLLLLRESWAMAAG